MSDFMRHVRRFLITIKNGISQGLQNATKPAASRLEQGLTALFERNRMSVIDDILSFFEERKTIPLTEVVRLIKEPPFDNAYLSHAEVQDFGLTHYGYSFLLAEYAGLGRYYEPLAAIEHGINLRDKEHPVPSDDDLPLRYPTLLCASLERKEMFDSLSVPGRVVETIGPYIAYAKPLLTGTEFDGLKRRLGRALVVFPSHSTDNVQTDFDTRGLIDRIRQVQTGGNYQTVWICLHVSDVFKGRAAEYTAAGFSCVTAGHRNDLFFLSRLRTIIELADLTMSNDFFTGLGYCLYLNRPHHMTFAEIHRSNTKGDVLQKRETHNQHVIEAFHPLLNKLFGQPDETITQAQLQFAEKYFGFSQVKSPDEMRQLLLDAESRAAAPKQGRR